MGILGTPLGWIMKWIYDFLFHFNIAGAYGWALVLFILLTKLLTYPLSVKQQKSTARMAAFQPKLKQLEKQYGKDKNRYQQEMMKLYEEEGINPMNGCLPMMVTFLLLFGIIDVIYNPLKHLLQVPADLIQEATQILGRATSTAQLEIISAIQNGSTAYDGLFDGSIMEQIQNFDMNFLGFNMGEIPNQVWGLLVIIPIVSFLTQIVSTLVSMKVQEKNGQKMQGGMKWFMLALDCIHPSCRRWFLLDCVQPADDLADIAAGKAVSAGKSGGDEQQINREDPGKDAQKAGTDGNLPETDGRKRDVPGKSCRFCGAAYGSGQ